MTKKSKKLIMKDKAWKQFSRFIRLRDCDDKGYGECYTCGTPLSWKEGQSGHYVESRCNSVLFDEELCKIQCCGCNIFKHGNLASYSINLMNDGYTKEDLAEMQSRKNKIVKYSLSDYEEIRDKYKKLADELERKFNEN